MQAGRFRKMTKNLFDRVANDFNVLSGRLGDCFSTPRAIERGMGIIQTQENIPGLSVFESLIQFDSNAIKGVTSLALASDCLRRISDAVLADGQVEVEELELAHSLIQPIANLYAASLDNYAHYVDLSPGQIRDFLTDFYDDNGWFGAGPQCEAELLGLTFTWVAAVIERDVGLYDIYPRIIERVALEVSRVGGLTVTESQSIGNLKTLHKTMRAVVEELICQGGQTKQQDFRKSSNTPSFAPSSHESPSPPAPEREVRQVSTEETLQQATADLESMIGLPGVKNEVRRLMSFLKIQQERKKHGLRESSQSLHFVFTGNPGTGKTTVARVLGKIFCGFGILSTAKIVETDRSQLVGGFLGQTAIKTDEVIQSALDGVLFIDEAYTLAGDAAKFGHGDMYGEEAINTLLKRMEDHRDRLIVIVAGYPAKMESLLRSNPGLESRFTRFIRFEDYAVPELCRIFEKFSRDHEYSLTPAARATAFVLFTFAHSRRDERFGNARFVRNVYEQAVSLHSERLATTAGCINKEALVTIDAVDIPIGMISGFEQNAVDLSESKWEAECPGCRRVSNVGMKFLGQRVNCKCGQQFVFPWWNPVVESIKGIPQELFAVSQPNDRLGIVETKLEKRSEASSPIARGQISVTTAAAWRPDPERGLMLMQQGAAHLDLRLGRSAIAYFEEAIAVDWPNSNPSCRAYYSYRATAYEQTGNDSPTTSCDEYNAAQAFEKAGQFHQAVAGYKRSIELDPEFLWAPNNLAWLFATHPDQRVRDGKLGIHYSKLACDRSDWHCWSFIDTLAASYAEVGDFGRALKTAESAMAVAPAEIQPKIRQRMKQLSAQQPIRQA